MVVAQVETGEVDETLERPRPLVPFSHSLAIQLTIGWAVGALTSAIGLAGSFAFDVPTGAAMVCAFGGALALSGVLYAFVQSSRRMAWGMHADRYSTEAERLNDLERRSRTVGEALDDFTVPRISSPGAPEGN